MYAIYAYIDRQNHPNAKNHMGDKYRWDILGRFLFCVFHRPRFLIRRIGSGPDPCLSTLEARSTESPDVVTQTRPVWVKNGPGNTRARVFHGIYHRWFGTMIQYNP